MCMSFWGFCLHAKLMLFYLFHMQIHVHCIANSEDDFCNYQNIALSFKEVLFNIFSHTILKSSAADLIYIWKVKSNIWHAWLCLCSICPFTAYSNIWSRWFWSAFEIILRKIRPLIIMFSFRIKLKKHCGKRRNCLLWSIFLLPQCI